MQPSHEMDIMPTDKEILESYGDLEIHKYPTLSQFMEQTGETTFVIRLRNNKHASVRSELGDTLEETFSRLLAANKKQMEITVDSVEYDNGL